MASRKSGATLDRSDDVEPVHVKEVTQVKAPVVSLSVCPTDREEDRIMRARHPWARIVPTERSVPLPAVGLGLYAAWFTAASVWANGFSAVAAKTRSKAAFPIAFPAAC